MDYSSYIDNMNFESYRSKFEYFKRLLSEECHIVECGAHYGEDTIRFLYTLPNCRLTTFECDPRNLQIMNKHLGNEPRCLIYPYAVGAENKTIQFYQAYKVEEVQDKYKWIGHEDFENYKLGNSGSSSLKKSSRPDLQNSIVIQVEMRTLDSFNLGPIDLLWIDVQGAERDLLLGSTNTLRIVKYIWIESGEMSYEDAMDEKETKQFLEDRDFTLIDQQGKDLLFLNNRFQ